MDQALVSVIIPTYSRPLFLERAIESVLNQSYSNFEIIVVDDNGLGTDNQISTEDIISSKFILDNVFYLKHDVNRNGCVARNTGLSKARGEYFTFLDDDDYMYPNRLETCVRTLVANTDYDICYSSFERRTENILRSSSLAVRSGDLQLDLLRLKWRFGTGSNPFFRANVYKSIGGFNEALLRKQDIDYVCRALGGHKIIAIPEVLIIKYVDSQSNQPNMVKYEAVVNDFFDAVKSELQKYPDSVVREIKRNHWFETSLLALKNRQGIFARYLRYSLSFKLLSFNQVLRFFKALIMPNRDR